MEPLRQWRFVGDKSGKRGRRSVGCREWLSGPRWNGAQMGRASARTKSRRLLRARARRAQWKRYMAEWRWISVEGAQDCVKSMAEWRTHSHMSVASLWPTRHDHAARLGAT